VRAVVKDHVGVDLRGEDAARVMTAAQPMIDWLTAREPDVEVRSLSVNDARVLVSVTSTPKPRALRIEAPDLREAGSAAEALIARLAADVISRRV